MVPEEILDDQNQDQEQEQEQGQEQEPNNSESEDITQAYAAKDWHSGELITSDSLDRIEIELEKLSKAYLAKLGEMIGATSSEAGVSGYVPAPPQLEEGTVKFLKSDGTWTQPPNDNDAVTQEIPITNNSEYPILLGKFTTENQGSYTNSVNRTQNSISINPSTGTITAAYFHGDGSQLENITIEQIGRTVIGQQTFSSSFIPTATSDDIGGVKIEDSTDPDNTISINQNGVISVVNPLPKVGESDVGKFLRVNEQGNWEACTILNAADDEEGY